MRIRLAAMVVALTIGAVMLAGAAAQAQEHVRLVPQVGTGAISSVAISPNGRFVLISGFDNTTQLWDVTAGQKIRSFGGSGATSVAFSPDGRFVLIGSVDRTARLWDAATGKQIRSFVGHTDAVYSVAFSPDGRFVITGSVDRTARLWDAATGRQIRSFEGHNGWVVGTAFSPDGRYVLTGSSDHTAPRLWDVATGQQIRSFGVSGVTSAAYSPDGRFLLIGSTDHTARLWNVATGRQIRSFVGNTDGVHFLAFSPDGRFVLTSNLDNTAGLWNATTGQQIRSFVGHTAGISSAVFSPDGRSVLTGSYDQTARLWDAASGQQIHSFGGHTSGVESVAFSRDGRFLLTGGHDRTARLWDGASGQQIRSFQGHTDGVESVAFSPDGRSVLTGSDDKTARLWNVANGQQIRSFVGHSEAVNSVVFSPDGRFVLTGSGMPTGGSPDPTKDQTARLWDEATGQQTRSLVGHTDTVAFVAFSPDGRSVLTGSLDHTARLWDAATGQQVRSFLGHTDAVYSVAFSPDGRFVITGSVDRTARLWDAATGKQIRSFVGHTDAINSLAFSPDGRYVLTGSFDSTVRLWDPVSGRQIRSFDGHTGWVQSVAFSPDGRFVLTGSADTTTRLWEAATGKQLATLLSFDDGGWAVTDPAGRYDSNDPDNTPGLVWETDSNRLIELRQLKDDYYTPNLLASIMKGERLPDVKGLNVVPAPPVVAIASPYSSESERLSLSIADQGGGVGRLVVSVNDRKVAALEQPTRDNSSQSATNSSKTEVSVDLSAATVRPGENTITAYAFDAGNQIRSHEAVTTFTVVAAGKGVIVESTDAMSTDYKPQFYGIVVGTSSFAGNHAIDLMYPAHDGESMMAGLEIGAGNLFGRENVHLRLLTTNAKEESGQPTKANIAAAFAEVTKKAKPTDVLLVYLSGHGVSLGREKDSYYYLTADARSLEVENNPALRELSTVSSGELRQWLGAKNMPLKEVLVLDTCAAGAANEELLKLVEERDVPPDQRRAVEFLKEATGTIILMGAAADKVSFEASKYGQGLLTYALLDGMRGRAVGEGGQLNVSKWFQSASEEVPLLAQTIGGIQKPVIAAPNGTGFPVALLTTADEAKVPLATIKPELLHLTCHDDNDEDPLGLAASVRAELREISHPSVRGHETEPPIVYLDDLTDGPLNSLTPKIVYTVSGSMVSLRLRIVQAGNTVGEERLSLSSADKNALVDAVAAKLVHLAAQVPLKDAIP